MVDLTDTSYQLFDQVVTTADNRLELKTISGQTQASLNLGSSQAPGDLFLALPDGSTGTDIFALPTSELTSVAKAVAQVFGAPIEQIAADLIKEISTSGSATALASLGFHVPGATNYQRTPLVSTSTIIGSDHLSTQTIAAAVPALSKVLHAPQSILSQS